MLCIDSHRRGPPLRKNAFGRNTMQEVSMHMSVMRCHVLWDDLLKTPYFSSSCVYHSTLPFFIFSFVKRLFFSFSCGSNVTRWLASRIWRSRRGRINLAGSSRSLQLPWRLVAISNRLYRRILYSRITWRYRNLIPPAERHAFYSFPEASFLWFWRSAEVKYDCLASDWLRAQPRYPSFFVFSTNQNHWVDFDCVRATAGSFFVSWSLLGDH